MAQTGYTPIKIYYSATPSAAPTAGNLANGELAINAFDGKLFYKDSSGVVQTIASKAAVINVSSISFGGTGLTPSTSSTGAVTVAGTLVPSNGGTGVSTTPSNGQLLIGNGTNYSVANLTAGSNISITNSPGGITIAATASGGTVTSVSGTGTVNGITLTGTVTSSGSLTLGGTLSGVSLTTQVSGTLPLANGGTGQTSAQAAMNSLAGAVTSGQYLRGNGTNVVMSAIQAADVPTLNQNTTGTASNVTGTVAVANGGTGATTLTANNVILGNGTSAVQFVAPGTAGNVLTSDGTTWTSSAAAASLTGITQSASPFETALGFDAGLNNTGTDGTFIGYYAGRAYTSGISNTAIGTRSSVTGTTGSYNTTVGAYSQGSSTGQLNCAFGWNSLNQSTSAYENAAYGARSIQQITTGFRNTACGYAALQFMDTGSLNTAIGYLAGQNVGSGTQNTLIGSSAGTNIATGSNNTVIGYNAAATSSSVSNEITLGNSSIATLRCQVTTITSLSDARDKTNISDLPAGLTFVKALRPVAFDWNMRDGAKVGEADTGFIAQDLQSAQESTGVNIPGLVYANNPDRLEAGYGKLIPVLVKAIQELSAEVERLKAQGAK